MRAGWIALAIATAFFVLEFLARVEPSLAVSAIAGFYHLKSGAFGTLSSLFFWVYAPMQIFVGLALDRYGARPFVLLGSFCCALGIGAFAATSTLAVGAAGRLLTGFGASFAFVAALYLVNHWFAPERFAVLSGGVNAAGMIGTAIGAPLLGNVIATAGWQSVFFATSAAGFVIFLLALLFLRSPQSPATTATSSPAQHIRESLGLVVSSSRVWQISIIGLLFYVPVNVYGGLWGNSELTAAHGLSATQAAFAISLMFWGMAVGSVASGYLADLFNHRKWVLFGGTVLTLLVFCIVLYAPVSGVWTMGSLLFLAGLSNGAQMLTFTMAKEGERNSIAGTVVAFVNMVGIAGALVFQPLVGYLSEIAQGNFGVAFSVMPVGLAVAALMILFLREERHPDHLAGARKPQEASR